ncbi:D-alanyl-D-alanine carboxypeptidase, partial [Arthrobacter sp. H41]|uniref:D-alanyl-D-alanine carboxypeptidase n=1 Tax=Arthrobacter sp. H41 TaxID=1312978 RepID=UPI001563CA4D
MTRPARLLLPGVLAVVLALLAVPLVGTHFPALQDALREPTPVAQPAVPKLQLQPEALSEPTTVTPLPADAPTPAPGILAPLLEAELHVPGDGAFDGVVLDARTGAVLWGSGEAEPLAPASNIKVLTAAAVMTRLPPDARLRTSVLVSGDAVFLRGGGDVLLTAGDSRNDDDDVVGRAGLRTLAADTAAALAEGSGPYRVYLDDTFFSGAALNPTWAEGDVAAGETAPVYSLAINSAWMDETRTGGPRFADAALAAAEIFAGELAAAAATRGIGVGGSVERVAAPPEATELAAAESATISEQVQRMLHLSDNYLAE